jgi:hypothetical protein
MGKPVECYSGSEYGERPRVLLWQGEWLTIAEISKRWRTPASKCFHVITQDGQGFEVCYAEREGRWTIRQI